MILCEVNKNSLKVRTSELLTAGSREVNEVEFRFNSVWDGVTKTAVFRTEKKTVSVLLDGDKTQLPWEVLADAGEVVAVGVYGVSGETLVLPTVWGIIGKVVDAAKLGDEEKEPTPDVYQQILDKLNSMSWDTLENKPFTSIGSGLKVEDGTLTATAQGGTDITITDTAEVGEVLTVEEVDSTGKPTKWKTEKPTAEQKQADWSQTDTTDASYIKNKPTIPDVSGKVDIAQGVDKSGEYLAVGTDGNVTTVDAPSGGEQVQSDWNENDETAKSYVKNRPFYISDTTELATLEFTATSSSKLTRTTTAADMALMRNFYTKGATFRAVINGYNRDFTTSFDRGYWSGSGQVSFRVNYNPNQTWDITSSLGLGLTTGQTYSITFYGLYKGYVKIPIDYLPSSLFTQENAPVKFHEEDGTMLTGVEQGSGTTASGSYSHAEGHCTTASGDYGSHAEGHYTTASGDCGSHAEGQYTTASGDSSHARGEYTTANRKLATVIGKYNSLEGTNYALIPQTYSGTLFMNDGTTYYSDSYTYDSYTGVVTLNNPQLFDYSNPPTNVYIIIDTIPESVAKVSTISKRDDSFKYIKYNVAEYYNGVDYTRKTGVYAVAVGNGTSDTARSNAYTLDWSGNGWFAGDVYVGSTSGTNKDDGSVKLLKESDVSSWAKQATKPTYTASEVGALPDTTVIPSVDGMLKYTAQTLTDSQKTQARTNIGAGTSSFSGSYADLTNKPTIPNVPEWAMADAKPTYTASEVGAVATAQGTANSGKYLAVGTDGNVTATDISKDNVVTALGYTPAKVTEEKWELVKTMTVEESVTSIEIMLDEPCSKVIIMGTQPSTESNAVGVSFLIRDSTTNNNISTPYLNAMIAAPTYEKSNYTYIWLDGDRMRCEFMAFNSSGSALNTLVAYTCPDISVSCNAITGFNFYRGTGFAVGIVWNIYGVKKEN